MPHKTMTHTERKARHRESNRKWLGQHPGYLKNWVSKNPDRVREYARRRKDKNPGATWRSKTSKRNNNLKFKYGITEADYQAVLQNQDGKCAICGQTPSRRKLSVDHNHRTGVVRGLLCNNCNTGVGYFQENPTLLQAAALYLSK